MLANAVIMTKSEIKNKTGRKPSPFPQVADNYISQLNIKKSHKKQYRSYLSKFMRFISQKYMNNCSFLEIDFNKIEVHHIESYVKAIKEAEKKTIYLYHLKLFFESIGINKFHFLLEKVKDPSTLPTIITLFIENLNLKKYSQTITNMKHINLFTKFLINNFPHLNINQSFDFSIIEEQHLIEYERYLISRADKGRIKKNYAYAQLRSLSLFIKYLKEKNLNDLRYHTPKFLQKHAGRRNDYIEEPDIKEMLKTLSSSSKNVKFIYRNIAVFLIIFYTGCRPIEVSNMNVNDIWKSDRTIMVKSKKSKKRRLSLNNEIMDYIKKYIAVRSFFSPKEESLFVTKDGKRLSPESIYFIFYKINKILYGESKNPPVAFRHTFITNACESGADLRTVANAAGHEHLISTDHYREKSPKRLLKNSMNHDPTVKFKEEFTNGFTG